MPFTEDFTAFLNTAEHATSAIYNSSVLVGIFDNDYILAGDEFGVQSTAPAFSCPSAKIPLIAHGDTLTIDSKGYTVRGVQPDGTGMTVIILEDNG